MHALPTVPVGSLKRAVAGGAALLGFWVAAFNATAPVARAQQPRPPQWTEATHGADARPDYGRVFALDRVHELRITIPAEQFRAMQEDLKAVVPGGGRGMPFPGGGGGGRGRGGPVGGLEIAALTAACTDKKPADPCAANDIKGQCTEVPFGGGGLACMPAGFGGMGRGGAPNLTTRDPIYVPVTVTHNGRSWTQVGMRYKGNSSLMSASASGSGKIPFRLDFDRYEDEHPAIRNQRFHGFQKLTFASNLSDDSQLRELLAVEVFRDRGVPAARAAFYRIYVDTGSGPEYWGLYTMIEDPADGAMLDAQFGSSRGNLYKPEGPGANWTLPFNPAGFGKKNNEREADFSDVQSAVAALHAPRDDPRAWRAALEARFDVDLFLRWLAVNTVIENWDAYGGLAHNYYLYGDPSRRGQLRWIPWDHNFAFGAGPGGGRGFPGAGGGFGRGGVPPPGRGGGAMPFGGTRDVLHRDVGDGWPLIKLLLADEVYAARYRSALEQALQGLLEPTAFERRARALHALIAPAVIGDRGERPTHTTVSSDEAFKNAIDGLSARLKARRDSVRAALAETVAR